MMQKTLTAILALLHALRLSHHVAHLTAKGPQFYQTHLMFERLYTPLVDEFDGIAEFAVSVNVTFDACSITRDAYPLLEAWEKTADPIERALKAELDLQKAIKSAVDSKLPAPLDNRLRTLADSHSTAIYLLQQSRA